MSISPVMNFIRLVSCFHSQKVHLSKEDIYVILEISCSESYYDKVVDNQVLYHSRDFGNFSLNSNMFMENRRDSVAVKNSSIVAGA